MVLIAWTEAQHGTKVRFVGAEYKELFSLLNKLYDNATRGAARSQVGSSLDTLIIFVVGHFSHEEKEMIAKNYSGYDRHKEEHTKLLKTCGGLQIGFHAGEAEVTVEVGNMVKDWLDHHIPTFDAAFADALNS
ncbi:MAG: hemerythrin family protein [Methylococcales bacterium]|nr:hemerythrin family protein [Methylococcales bacterium]